MEESGPELQRRKTTVSDNVALAHAIRVLEGIGVIAAIATAFIGFFQWKTAKSTSEHTALTTRPWVRVNGIIDKDGLVTVAYRNDGHSPAQIMPSLFAQFFERKLSPSEAEKRLDFSDELSTQWPTGIATKVVGADTGSIDSKLVPRASIGPEDVLDPEGKKTYRDSRTIVTELSRKVLYVWGAVLYNDGLKQQHLLKICFEHRPGDSELMACPFLNTLNEDVDPPDAECVAPQFQGRASHHDHPCKQSDY